MKRLVFDLFPGRKRRVVTFSYDDGVYNDMRLCELFDKYGAKCTFNLNTVHIGEEGRPDPKFYREISDRHEIACHGYTHPFFERLPLSTLMSEVYEDKKALEDLIGKPIIGMAYPYGTWNRDAIDVISACGLKYARVTAPTNRFVYPDNWLEWTPTCHHRDALGLVDAFLAIQNWMQLPMFYVWGHSYEFREEGDWAMMEELLKKLSEKDDVWYATNGEIYDYMTALRSLRVTADETAVVNPTATTVLAHFDGKETEIKPGFNKLA